MPLSGSRPKRNSVGYMRVDGGEVLFGIHGLMKDAYNPEVFFGILVVNDVRANWMRTQAQFQIAFVNSHTGCLLKLRKFFLDPGEVENGLLFTPFFPGIGNDFCQISLCRCR